MNIKGAWGDLDELKNESSYYVILQQLKMRAVIHSFHRQAGLGH